MLSEEGDSELQAALVLYHNWHLIMITLHQCTKLQNFSVCDKVDHVGVRHTCRGPEACTLSKRRKKRFLAVLADSI